MNAPPVDWKAELRAAYQDWATLPSPSPPVAAALQAKMPIKITPHYWQLIQGTALEPTLLPQEAELVASPGESQDPMAEEACSPLPGLIHKYPNRVLLLLTNQCAVHCRYCTRGREVGQPRTSPDVAQVKDYLLAHPEVNEVIFSGGDPLVLGDQQLSQWMDLVSSLPQIKVKRISSKVPVVLPSRIQPGLCSLLAASGPWFVNLHVLHPLELTPEAIQALHQLRQAGCILGSQTPLLKGVNDDPATLIQLNLQLLSLGVRPYALYQCDPVPGSGHFRTPLETGLDLISALRRELGGMALPQFIADPPGGKVNLHPQNQSRQPGQPWKLKNWQGQEVDYRD